MPNLPISLLPQSGPLQGDELFVTVQDGVTKYTTANSLTYLPGNNYGLFTQTESSIPVEGSAITAPTSGSLIGSGLGTLTVPANAFQKGDAYQACLAGVLSIANNHTLDIHIFSDGIDFVDTGVLTFAGATDKNWRLDIDFNIREIGPAGTASIVTSGILHYRQNAATIVSGEIFSFNNNTTFDTTVNNTLNVEAILGSSCGVTEYIYSEIFSLYKTF